MVIDTANAFGYFGSSTPIFNPVLNSSFGVIDQVNLQTFAQLSAISRVPASTPSLSFSAATIDLSAGFIYFGSSGTAPGVDKLEIGPGGFHIPFIGSKTTLPVPAANLASAVVDSKNGFIYFGTQTNPSLVIKLQESNLALVSSQSLPTSGLNAAVIDTVGGFAYFGSSATPGTVTKIQLSNFSVASTLTFNPGEGGVASAVIDTKGGFAYFGTNDSPGKVVKVNLSSFTETGSITLLAGQNNLTSAVIDPLQGFAYFGTETSPGTVVQVNLTSFAESQAVTLNVGENNLMAAGIDPANDFAYFGTDTPSGMVVKVDLFPNLPTILGQPQDVTVSAGQAATFSVSVISRSPSYQWQVNGVNIPGATSASYITPLASLSDNGNLYRCLVSNTNGTSTSGAAVLTVLPVINVFPNPWRVDRHAGAKITFNGLPSVSTIRLFTLSGHWIKSLQSASGAATWDLTNDAGEKVASGYYFYLITTSDARQTVKGKIGVIQ